MNMVEKMHEEEIRGSTIRNANLSVAAVVSPQLATTTTISTSTSSSSQLPLIINQQQSSSPPATPTLSNHISHIILNNNNNTNNNVAIANSSSSSMRNVIVSVNANHHHHHHQVISNDDHSPSATITTSTTSSLTPVLTTSGHNDNVVSQQQQQQIISDPSSVGSKESAELDLNDGQFNETSEGYPENSGGSNNNSQQGYISILPPVGGSVSVPCDQTDLKYIIEELCPVCGDKVSGYHYGLLTCESCKGFFKRTVQNKKVYTCVAERSCHIDKTQRKRCPFCRFQKCLEVGMKLEAVRADRMRGGRNKFGPMYKRDRARKLQILRQRQLALQAIRGSMGGGSGGSNGDGAPSQLSPTGYQQPYTNMQIKQEIQIPQVRVVNVSSLTSSPDSSPSPIVLALSQVNPVATTTMSSLSSGPTNSSTTTSVPVLQNPVTDSKLWLANSTTASPHSLSPKTFSFDSGTNPTSTVDSGSGVETLRVSPMIREFVQTIDDREWQQQLYSLLQSQSYNQCEVDLFELMCKVLDQNLFSQVDWARNTTFFKDLKVDDQMKLLQNSWSDMLVLDHLHHRIHNGLPDETTLPNGQKFDLLGLGLLGVPLLAERFNELQNKLLELKFDVGDYICMKFLLLLNPERILQFTDVRGITNRKTVLEGYENVQAALLDYTLTCYPSVTDKFSKLLSIIPEIHAMAARGEEHLYLKHVAGSAPTQTLLMEMLHAKRK